MSNKHFIVLSGEAGAGKDSIADILVADHGYRKISLSDEMKRFCMRAFGWTNDQLYGPSSFRNAPDPKLARPCPDCKATGCIYCSGDKKNPNPRLHIDTACKSCEGTGKINDNSPRRILQLLGDEWGRQMIHPDIWTMIARPHLEEKLFRGVRIVINDARFENDRVNLQSWLGAKLVDVRSTNTKDDGATWRQHASEQSRPSDEQVDHIVQNDETWPFPSLKQHVTEMLVKLYNDV